MLFRRISSLRQETATVVAIFPLARIFPAHIGFWFCRPALQIVLPSERILRTTILRLGCIRLFCFAFG